MAIEQEIHISLTAKQAVAIIVALVALLGTYPVANLLTPNARVNPFTGTQGREMDDRLTIVELQIAQTIENDGECKIRQDAMKNDLTWLRELVTTYQSSAKERDAGQDWKLDQCMRKL